MKVNRQCRRYKEKSGIAVDLFIGGTPVNCGNCKTFNGVRCSNEKAVVESQNPELVEEMQW